MPIFMVERAYAEALEGVATVADGINRINDEEDVRWLYMRGGRRQVMSVIRHDSPPLSRILCAREGPRSWTATSVRTQVHGPP